LTAETVWVCEGEKASDALNSAFESAGLFGPHVATTNAQGAGKWRDEFCEPLDGKAVIVLPDNDAPGAKHGAAVCTSIQARGKAKSLKRLDLPGLPPKGDAFDWLDLGGEPAQLLELLEQAPNWETTQAEEKPTKFRFRTLGEVLAQEPPEWLVHGLLTQGGTSLLTAKHASFKSFFALDLALCVATGKEWHAREVKRGPVLYIAAEGASGLQRRAKAWLEHYGLTEKAARLLVWDRPIALHEPDVLSEFIQAINQEEPALIVVDTLARCAVGLEENSSADMGRYADAVDALARATGAHVLTVHHNNKGGEYRGSTALPAAVDTHISLERKGECVTLKTEKQKDAEEGASLTFALVEVPSGSLVFQFKGIEDVRAAMNASDEKVREALCSFGPTGATNSEWKAACSDVSESTFKRAYNRLIETGEAALVPGFTKGERGAKFTIKAPLKGPK
jgi:hypothetical protein